MYLKRVNKITLEWVHVPSDQQSSKYVPWQECLLRQWITFFNPLFKITLKYVVVSIYLFNLIIRATLIHLEIRNIPHMWCVQTSKLWIQATGLKIVFAHPEKSQVPAPTTTLQSNCKAPGHSRQVKKGGNSLKLIGFHPGSLTGNMCHIYTGSCRIFELSQASWPKSSYISLTTCFFLAFQALVPPEANYHH